MEHSIEFGDLSHDEDFKNKLQDFTANLEQVEKMIQNFCSLNTCNMTPANKVRYELFQAFTISSLYWFYLRIQGIDPNQHEIRSELNRIRDFMVRSKKIYEKQTLMPKINQEAAKRFIRSSLWTPHQFSGDKENKMEEDIESRKRKLDLDADDNKYDNDVDDDANHNYDNDDYNNDDYDDDDDDLNFEK